MKRWKNKLVRIVWWCNSFVGCVLNSYLGGPEETGLIGSYEAKKPSIYVKQKSG